MFVVLLLGGGIRERQDNFTISIISNFSIKLGGLLLKAKITRFFQFHSLLSMVCVHIQTSQNWRTPRQILCYSTTLNHIYKLKTLFSKSTLLYPKILIKIWLLQLLSGFWSSLLLWVLII